MIERIEVNLLPPEYRVRSKTYYFQREIVYPALALIISLVVFFFWGAGLVSQLSIIESNIENTEQLIKKNEPIKKEIKNLEEQNRAIGEKIIALKRIDVNREKWIRLFEIFCRALPEYSWINNLKEIETGKKSKGKEKGDDKDEKKVPLLELNGSTFSFPEVADYMSNLVKSEYILNVELESITPKGEKSFNFKMKCEVNSDAKLSRERLKFVGDEAEDGDRDQGEPGEAGSES